MMPRWAFTTLVKRERQLCRWNVYDVGVVCAIVICAQLAGYKLLRLTEDQESVYDLIDAVMQMMSGGVTLAWVWLLRGVSPRELGFRKGWWGFGKSIGIAVVIAVLCGTVMLALRGVPVHPMRAIAMMGSIITLVPLSPVLCGCVILAPLSDEIKNRGLLYTYLRSKYGVVVGLLVQAALSGVLHFTQLDQFPMIFIVSLIFGVLYEMSGSLYPSIVGHAVYNMTVIAVEAAAKPGV